ncbi:acyl-CoA dehydrogenase NM domain-like protein [Gonapodya prolifera JEL478]|uniref:Isobutyryl-CoA dehydrogenase, mitochondrial n=1 Tax=Gonapodya prolifera (strain JEL478) TaxID=1344416 RepID=A0A139AJ64_GONPJ|nr:acyl-CoA dehydrogenase NM domain-like protein [Gonapodya prolifera JEL478]|eukprot:KXS16832.1 acyl-CoA dehydrogenase NM domain-like protein [Gonapodya prolifera JEL478]
MFSIRAASTAREALRGAIGRNQVRLFGSSEVVNWSHGLTDEQIEYQSMAKKFADAEFAPNMRAWDQTELSPQETIRKAGGLGFGAIYCSPAFGGTGLGHLDASIIFEALATGCVSTTALLYLHNMCAWVLDNFGKQPLKERILPEMASLQKMASYCLTEPNSGSDAASITTKAVKRDGYYILNGSKAFISGAGDNELYFVFARTSGHLGWRGISCFLVEKGTPGLSFGAKEKKMGWNSQSTRAVIFEDCAVPEGNLIGEEGRGFLIAMSALTGGRLNVSSASLGGAQAAIDASFSHVQNRKQFGVPLSHFQNTQFRLVDMAAALHSARLVVRSAADSLDKKEPSAKTYSAIAKIVATERCYEICDQALQLFGGYGYLKDYPVEQYLRDLRVHRILGGTNEVMRGIVAKEFFEPAPVQAKVPA